jgi:hypothetical protein
MHPFFLAVDGGVLDNGMRTSVLGWNKTRTTGAMITPFHKQK